MKATLGAVGNGLRAAFWLAVGRSQPLLALADAPGPLRASFLAAPICLALLLPSLVQDRMHPPHGLAHAVLLQALGFVIGWAGFLLASRPALARLGLLGRWPRMVVAWNWCNVPQQVLVLLAGLPSLLHAPVPASEFAWLVVFGWALWIEWQALRLALSLGGLAAAGLVLLDTGIGWSISLAISAWATRGLPG